MTPNARVLASETSETVHGSIVVVRLQRTSGCAAIHLDDSLDVSDLQVREIMPIHAVAEGLT